jgi:hypothetical protein
MLALPLFAAASLALAPTGGDYRLELALDGEFTATAVSPPGATAHGLGTTGQGSGRLSVFSRRVVDDDAPPDLQPFLQRVSELRIEGGGGGLAYSPPADSNGAPPYDGASGFVDLSGHTFFDRLFYAYASFGVHDVTRKTDSGLVPASTSSMLTLPLAVAGGLRFGDFFFSLGWRLTPTSINGGEFEVPFWGGAWLHFYGVVHRRLALVAEVEVEDGGASGIAQANVYVLRRFAVIPFVRGGAAHLSNTMVDYGHAGGGLALQVWASARFAATVDYSFDWYRYDSNGESIETDYRNLIDLSFRLRPR